MIQFLLTSGQVLLWEVAGVGILTAILYLYWNLMTRR